ncbi:MAG: hypothetical protein GEU94_17250 [Micromonosporaceae bacterium]|nr:hypothetical protein [Micromonosporaceae bacterium]
MFEEILGLPAHPLIVHAAVVLVPLLVAVAIAYALIPPLRGRLDWAVVVLAVAAPAAVWAARQSGEAFQLRLAQRDMMPPELAADVAAHEELSEVLWWLALALGVAAVALVAADRLLPRRPGGAEPRGAESGSAGSGSPGSEAPRGGGLRLVVTVVLTLAIVGLSGAAGWYVYRTGHTGSTMVWEGS